MNRSEARELALAALYEAEQRSDEPDTADLSARARRLVESVWTMREELDRAIDDVAEGWRVERMPIVDRNVLRIGLYELRATDIPVGVVVSEAVRLAKKFSTARSGPFVNGVLATLAHAERSLDAPSE